MTDRQQRPLEEVSSEPYEMELSDEDILAAMANISGYLDITTEDFRALYHLAHQRAVARMFAHIRADRLMRRGVDPLAPDLPLAEAARLLVRGGIMALPVADAEGRVLGMLTEADFFRRLHVDSFLELILRLLEDPSGFTHRFHETTVREAMTSPAVTLPEDASFREIAAAFHQHEGRATPVVDGAGRLRGLLLRRDFIGACKLPSAI
jgi:CBS domain-containing membrane protein